MAMPSEHFWLELVGAVVICYGGWLKLQEIALASKKNAEAIGTVHTMINSELAKWKEEVVARMTGEVKLAYAKGLDEGGSAARAVAASTMVAAAAALPPVIVPAGEPDPNHVGI